MLIERLNAELDRLKVPAERRDICLIWDEVNLKSQLLFKIVQKKHSFFGMVDSPREQLLMFNEPIKEANSTEERIVRHKATHLLVMQVTFVHTLTSFGLFEKTLW